MKKIGLTLAFFIFSLALVNAQVKSVVDIKFQATKKSKDVYELSANFTIDPKWHVYGLTGGEGPVSTSFDVLKAFKGKWVDVIGKPTEKGKKIAKYEEAFKSNVQYFENKVEFVLKVKRIKPTDVCIPVVVEYMVCNENECLPPTKKTGCVVLK